MTVVLWIIYKLVKGVYWNVSINNVSNSKEKHDYVIAVYVYISLFSRTVA